MESRHQTGRHAFVSFISFIWIDLNCASGATSQHEVVAPDGAAGVYFI
jgi:hypothetical protein